MRKIRTYKEIEIHRVMSETPRLIKKLMMNSSREHRSKSVGRSLNNPKYDKSEYLERKVREYKRFDINISHANIVLQDFGTSVYEFMKQPLTDKERKYLYLSRSKYGNNRRV